MPSTSIDPSGDDLRDTEDSAAARPADHAGIMPEGPWSIRHMTIDARISRLLESGGIVDLRDASRERMADIKGIGPAAVTAFERSLPTRLDAIAALGIHVPTSDAVLNGTDPYARPASEPAPAMKSRSPTRTKKDGSSSTGRKPARTRAGKGTASVVHEDPVDPPVTPDHTPHAASIGGHEERTLEMASETPIAADETNDLQRDDGDGPQQEAASEIRVPSDVLQPVEPHPVALSGGTIIARNIDANRMLVLCHDRYLLPHVAEACVDAGGTPEGRGWILDVDAYHRVVETLRSASFGDGLRERNQVWSRVDPTHRTPRGALHIRPFETGGKAYVDVKSHPYEETMVRRLDVVCPALGGKWNPMKRCWAVHAHQQTALLRAMEPDEAPRERGQDEYGVPDRTFRESGLEYASVFGNKPDLDWYEANGQIILVDTPEGRVEIVRVDPEVWIARKPNKGNPGINATITEACGTMLGSQGNWHPPFAGRRFRASRAGEVIARLKEGLPKDDTEGDFPHGLF